jgi:hypothetical protein
MRVEEGAVTAHDLDLAALGHAGQTAGQLADDLVLVGAQLVDIDRRCGEGDAEIVGVLGFFHDRRDVQQGLGRNAADVEADAAEGGVALDDDRLHAEVGRAEGGRVTAGAGAEDEHLALDVGTAGMAAGDRSGHRSAAPWPVSVFAAFCGLPGCCGRSGCAPFNLDQQGAFATLAPS